MSRRFLKSLGLRLPVPIRQVCPLCSGSGRRKGGACPRCYGEKFLR